MSWAGPLLGPGHLAGRSRRAARDCLASLQDGPARPVEPSPPVLSDEDKLELRHHLLLLLRATSQMETISTLPTKSSSDIEWTWRGWLSGGSSPNLAYSNFGLIATLGQRLGWSSASPREGLTDGPPMPTYPLCRHVCSIDPSLLDFDQQSTSPLTTPPSLTIPPFRRLTDSPVTGPVSPQVTNYDFRLNLVAFSEMRRPQEQQAEASLINHPHFTLC